MRQKKILKKQLRREKPRRKQKLKRKKENSKRKKKLNSSRKKLRRLQQKHLMSERSRVCQIEMPEPSKLELANFLTRGKMIKSIKRCMGLKEMSMLRGIAQVIMK
jgi:predicted secreted protein